MKPESQHRLQRRLQRLAKRINPLRVSRFYRRGYVELGRIFDCTYTRNDAGVERAIRRANWVFNLARHGRAFDSSV